MHQCYLQMNCRAAINKDGDPAQNAKFFPFFSNDANSAFAMLIRRQIILGFNVQRTMLSIVDRNQL